MKLKTTIRLRAMSKAGRKRGLMNLTKNLELPSPINLLNMTRKKSKNGSG